MQKIHATCEDDLSSLKSAGDKYLKDFKIEHDEDHEFVLQIQEICNKLIEALRYYADSNYGATLELGVVKTEANTFATAFYPQYVNASDLFTRLENGISHLVELNTCFIAQYNLTCLSDDSDLSGCEAELNEVRCILSSLTNLVPGAAEQAFDIVSYLRYGAISLNQKTRAFSLKYYLACIVNGPQCCESDLSLDVVRFFFNNFNDLHDLMHTQFVKIVKLCSNFVDRIDDMQGKLSA